MKATKMYTQSALSPHLFFKVSLTAEDLRASPMCINTMKLMQYAQLQDGIPLTKMSNFYRKCVEWAAVEFNWPGYEAGELYAVNKVLNEPDFPPLLEMHSFLLTAKLIRHFKEKAVLTKKGTKMLGQHGELQSLLADYMLAAPYGDDNIANSRFWDIEHFFMLVSSRLNGWVTIEDFAFWAVPVDLFIAPDWSSPLNEATLFTAIQIVRPMVWLGLIEEGAKEKSLTVPFNDRPIRKSSLFDSFVKMIVQGVEASGTMH